MEKKLYCAACRRIAEEGETCPHCGERELRPLLEEDPVFLAGIDAESFGFLKENLEREKIAFEAEEQPLPPDGSVYSGKALLPGRDIYVAARDLERADAVLSETFASVKEMNAMPQKKRIAVQIVSVFLFVVLIYLVIRGADAVAAFIRNLFS